MTVGLNKSVSFQELPSLMQDLRLMARRLLQHESKAQSVRPTALVHSALLRMIPKGQHETITFEIELTWENREQFLQFAYKAMTRLLVEYARKRNRGEDRLPRVRLHNLNLSNLIASARDHPELIEAMVDILERWKEIGGINRLWAEILHHRYWSGLSNKEISQLMNRSLSTINRYHRLSLAVLAKEILEF